MGKQRMGVPHVVRTTEGIAKEAPLRRVTLRAKESLIDEAWLQRLIDETPGILPITEVYSKAVGSVVSLGREIATPSGPIDNLLLCESGHVVVVETKLWRNPEARRVAVAQILDYATHVKKWDYARLEALWRARHGTGRLVDTLASGEDEASFVDAVNDNLECGEMVLLVVGDGIASRAESLAGLIGSQPGMQFRLALVELQLFQLKEDAILVVPHTLLRTKEVERTTVRIIHEQSDQKSTVVEVATTRPDSRPASKGRRSTLDSEGLLETLLTHGEEGKVGARTAERLLGQIEEVDGLVVVPRSAGVSVRAKNPSGSKRLLSLFVVGNSNLLYAYPGWLKEAIASDWGLPEVAELLEQKWIEVLARQGFTSSDSRGTSMWAIHTPELADKEDEFMEAVIAFLDAVEQQAARVEQQ